MTRPATVRHLPEIGITVISRWVFNCYVIHDRGDDRPVVVDLGLPSYVGTVEQVLRDRGQELSDLGGVVATHGHVDHVGGIPSLSTAAAASVPLLLPRTIEAMLGGTAPLRSPGPRAMARILPVLTGQPRDFGAVRELAPVRSQIGYDGRGIQFPRPADTWLADGDVLPGSTDWQVLHTPGHTDDSTCLYHAPTRTLISGDSVVSFEGRAWCNPEYVDVTLSAESESRLRSLDVEHVLPGHGPVVEGRDVMGRALSFDDRPPRSGALRSLWRIAADHSRRHHAHG